MAEENKEELTIVERFGQADDPNNQNKAEVPKLRAARKYKVVTEKLLGKFDENGKYVIEPHIMAELLAMPKLLDKEDATRKMELTAEYKDGSLFKFVATEPRRKKAQANQEQQSENAEQKKLDPNVTSLLEIIEEVKFAGGYETETISTIVGTFKTLDLFNFDKNRRSAFNIYNRDDPDAKKRTPTDNIDARRTYLTLIEEIEGKNFEKTEKKFYKNTLKALKKIPGGRKILSQIKNKQDVLDNFFDKKDKSKYRAYNDMLSIVLNDPENENFVKSAEYQKNVGKINKEYLNDMHNIDKEVKSNKKLADIKKGCDLVAAVPVEEYYQSLVSDDFNNPSLDVKSTKTLSLEKQFTQAQAENIKNNENLNVKVKKTKLGGKKEKDAEVVTPKEFEDAFEKVTSDIAQVKSDIAKEGENVKKELKAEYESIKTGQESTKSQPDGKPLNVTNGFRANPNSMPGYESQQTQDEERTTTTDQPVDKDVSFNATLQEVLTNNKNQDNPNVKDNIYRDAINGSSPQKPNDGHNKVIRISQEEFIQRKQ